MNLVKFNKDLSLKTNQQFTSIEKQINELKTKNKNEPKNINKSKEKLENNKIVKNNCIDSDSDINIINSENKGSADNNNKNKDKKNKNIIKKNNMTKKREKNTNKKILKQILKIYTIFIFKR